MTTRERTTTRLPWDAADPFAYYADRRAQGGPVVWDDTLGAWLILGYYAARMVLGKPGWSSNPQKVPNAARAVRAIAPELLRRNMLTADGHDHRRLRGSVGDAFTPRFITGLAAGVEAIATETINRIPASAPFDFVADIALPLPLAVAAAWLDLDIDCTRLLREESPAISKMIGDMTDPETIENGTDAFATVLAELLPLAALRRAHPGDDLISFIAADPSLELDDVVTTALIIAVAGHETTANLLGASIIRLLTPVGPESTRPIDTVESVDDRLIAELLRMDGPVQAVARTATTDHVISGVTIDAHTSVLVVLGGANRDPAAFDQPDQLQPHRDGPAPIAFGHGPHHCLGAALAHLVMKIALELLLARPLKLAGHPTWRDNPAIRGPLLIPATFI